jgi:hypothetical protein
MKYEITKGSEKDFEGAPEWSTIIYNYRNSDTIRFCNGWKEGCKFSGTKEFLTRQYDVSASDLIRYKIIAERRPITEPVWDGEGLMPSVGMKCLAKQCSQINADEFLVVAIQDGAVFGFWTATGAAAGLDVNRWIFLPIPSPEDVAKEKERSEQCDKIFGILSGVERTGNRSDMAEALYDAGYRKVDSSSADLKISITTDEMWREFEKNSDMEDVYKLITKRMVEKLCGF